MQTSPSEGTKYRNFILIATIHMWNQSVENSLSPSPSGCDSVTSLMSETVSKDREILRRVSNTTVRASGRVDVAFVIYDQIRQLTGDHNTAF